MAVPTLAYSWSKVIERVERTVTEKVFVLPDGVWAVRVTGVSAQTPDTLAVPPVMEITRISLLLQVMASFPSPVSYSRGTVKSVVTEEKLSPSANTGPGMGVRTFPSLITGRILPLETFQ